MNRLITVLGLLVAFAFTAAPAGAQMIYLQGGADFPSSSALNQSFETGFNVGVGVGIPVTPYLEGVIQGSYDRFGGKLSGSDAFSSYSATGHLKLNGPPVNRRFMPYAKAGGGLFRLGIEEAFETEFGLEFGAGVGIRTARRVNLMVEPNYVLVLTEGENVQYFPIRIGASFAL